MTLEAVAMSDIVTYYHGNRSKQYNPISDPGMRQGPFPIKVHFSKMRFVVNKIDVR